MQETHFKKGTIEKISIYVACHYDFSQLEYVGPFLERFHGSKVFMYKWNGLYDKMKPHYSSAEYKAYKLQVYDFSLFALCQCIANESPGTKVVFLLTAGMAYSFGKYQKALFQCVKDAFPEKVWGISVIGHCMYGCMSCSGVDHKVPVYYSRYVRGQLIYTSTSLAKQYFGDWPREKVVLVAPSIGETSMLQQRQFLDYLHSMELEGKFKFVFKLHPSSFNDKSHDLSYEPDRREYDNVKFILKTFTVTSTEQPCLLPFIEACDTILCDLHSSVGFITSYFAPRRIFSYHNDTGYDVPDRDPDFLANFYIFDTFEGLQQLFAEWPTQKGSNKFFEKEYGLVDGNECDRFAKLANWPLDDTVLSSREESSDSAVVLADKYPDYLGIMSSITDEWYRLLREAYEKDKLEPDEEFFQGCKEAIGLDARFVWKPQILNLPLKNDYEGDQPLKVMSFNIWHGGEAHPDGNQIENIAAIIVKSGADVVGLQEVEGKPDAAGDRKHKLDVLVSHLQQQSGEPWRYVLQGILTPGKGSLNGWGLVTRLEVVKYSKGRFGTQLKLFNGKLVWLYNTHLPYFPYQPYQISHIPYEDSPFINNEEDAIDSSKKSRSTQIDALLKDIEDSLEADIPIILTGDLNEPSHLDWQCKSSIAGYHALSVSWPQTKKLEESGFVDAYRAIHPNTITKPAFTWCPRNQIPALIEGYVKQVEHHDRIDFVFVKGKNINIVDAKIIGSSEYLLVDESVAQTSREWPSDHQAVLVNLKL